MSTIHRYFILQIFLTSLIGLVSYIGDKGLKNGKTELVRALSDNITHATVGGLTWTLVVVLSRKNLFVIEQIENIILCFLMSSFIDMDHFIAAGSWDINNATHLHHRPFLHTTTVPIVLYILLNILAKLINSSNTVIFSWMIVGSFVSHQVRDGNRRGLWFWPFGSTQPIPYYLYMLISMVLPYFIQWTMQWQLKKPVDSSKFIV